MIRALRSMILDIKYPGKVLERSRCTSVKTEGKNVSVLKNAETKGPFFLAAHVGAGFCRAAILCSKGRVIRLAVFPCRIYTNGIFSEMSSDNIWTELIKCIQKVVSGIEQRDILGIGFIAVPALVCIGDKGNPVTASTSRNPNRNVILHYDNRSLLECARINKTRHSILQYFGEKVFPDFQDSKLMWLKHNLRDECWNNTGHFFDLADFLTWKATGSLIRSSSTLVTQWSYEIKTSDQEGWNPQYFYEIDIPEIIEDNFRKIGAEVQRPGKPLSEGLSEGAAKEMGLSPKLPVATGMPDSLAGCLGVLDCHTKDIMCDVNNRLCIVFGTKAASQFVLSREPRFVKGIKGPFRDSVLPDLWLNHAVQTTAESILEYIIDTHPATPEITKQIGHMHIHKYLNKILKIKAQKTKLKCRSFLTNDLHILPDFEGNKSPIGDPWIRGMISGLSITQSQDNLALTYLATMQALAYSTRHITSTLSQYGHDIRCILIGGTLGKNSLFVQLQKDVCQLPTISPQEPKSKLVGAAILAGVASNYFRDFDHALQEMCGYGQASLPKKDEETISYHERKYQVFLKMYDHQMEYRRIMQGGDKVKNISETEI